MRIIQQICRESSPIPYLAPFLVYMLCTSLEPESSSPQYLCYYGVKIVLTIITLGIFFLVLKQYLKFPGFQGILAGIAGAFAWIALCQLPCLSLPEMMPNIGLEQLFPVSRPGTPLDGSPLYYAFRLTGLILLVPIVEEWFLRGFLLRFVCEMDKTALDSAGTPLLWWQIPFGTISRLVIITSIIYPLLTHPEVAAGIVWFMGITILAWKTRSLSDCIVAHAITNAALGMWVFYSGQTGLM